MKITKLETEPYLAKMTENVIMYIVFFFRCRYSKCRNFAQAERKNSVFSQRSLMALIRHFWMTTLLKKKNELILSL